MFSLDKKQCSGEENKLLAERRSGRDPSAGFCFIFFDVAAGPFFAFRGDVMQRYFLPDVTCLLLSGGRGNSSRLESLRVSTGHFADKGVIYFSLEEIQYLLPLALCSRTARRDREPPPPPPCTPVRHVSKRFASSESARQRSVISHC